MINTFSGNRFRQCARATALGAAAVLGMVVGSGSAGAAVDNARTLPLGNNNAIEVLQADTSIQSYPPLDSSPVSFEFFHDEVVSVNFTGPDADSFQDTKLTIGYQIGYPVALNGAIVHINTPSLDWEVGNEFGIGVELAPEFALGLDASTGATIGGSIIPSQEIEVDLAPGGITDVAFVEDMEFDGRSATVRLAGVHGSVSGALGPVTIRPYARAVTSNNDTVITYGVPHRL
ncbi:MspA family porin [Rhodococcus rhodochrous]|uniref:Membrane protein n=1 Tax=Rhodococcus rhodochrous KG-21 TaxID=1441923 RepID=A0A0M8PI25_RHORH|nr:MspA family porin [Rhodococcus rhodochrous]KOS56756.1 membrane protein [Rhodococcus rhodochrous KG-21]